ncbi:hypothetical protein BC629DRAFT_1594297 [Irpex lacteus]|nr:hypothetical protein BC629DRAFT_1594297 [Irpex lacteus]
MSVFSTLRVYALLVGKARLLSGVVFGLNMVPFGVYLFTFVEARVQVIEDACVSVAIGHESDKMRLRYAYPLNILVSGCSVQFTDVLSLAAHIAGVVAGTIVLLVTWYTTYSLFKETRRLGFRTPLTTLLLRDGTVYFLLLLVVNVFQVLTSMLPLLIIWVIADALLSLAVPIVVCRFILNLRQIDYSGDSTIIAGDQTFSLRFVGSLGGPLQTSTDDELADEGYDEHVAQGMRPRRTDTGTAEAGKEGLAGHTD